MKTLFYLPVVTPWWFDNIVEPLVREMAAVSEVHVLASEPWSNTGIGQREVDRCADLPGIYWSIIGGEGHEAVRTKPEDPDQLIEHVRAVDPDYVLCRSADFETPGAFPGKVRFIMEGIAAPFLLPTWISLQPRLFDQGFVPDLTAKQQAYLDDNFTPVWNRLVDRMESRKGGRADVLQRAGIDPERPMLLLPLEYEHEENFFTMHRLGARPNHRLVSEIAAQLPDGVSLAVTDHPLNQKYVDDSELKAEIATLGDHVVLVEDKIDDQAPTIALAPHAEAILLGDSKVFTLAGFFGVPVMRRSIFESADWLRVMNGMDELSAAMAANRLPAPDRDAARRWFAYHLANDAFEPNDPDLTADEIRSRMDRQVDEARWDAALQRLREAEPELF